MLFAAAALGIFSTAAFCAAIELTRRKAAGVEAADLGAAGAAAFVAVFLSMFFAGASLSVFLKSAGVGLAGTYALNAFFQLAFIAATLAFARKFSVRIGASFGFAEVKTGFAYFIASLSALACGGCVSIVCREVLGVDIEMQKAVEMFAAIDSAALKVFAFFAVAVLAPIAEELFFRGLLYPCAKGWFMRAFSELRGSPELDALRRKAAAVAAAVAVSAFFSAIHASAFAALPIFMVGIVLTCCYERSGSIFAPMITHSLFNILNISVILCS